MLQISPRILLAWVALFLGGALLPACGEEKPKPDKPTPEMLPEIDWRAEHTYYPEDGGAIVFSGAVQFTYQGIKIEGDHIVFFRETKEVYAEGHLRIRQGESELAAEVAYFDLVNQRGYLIDATMRASLLPKTQTKKQQQQQQLGQSNQTLTPDTKPDAKQNDKAYEKALRGEASFLKDKDPYGVYLDVEDDPQARRNLIFSANKIVLESRLHYSADDAFLTLDDMADPLYGVKLKRLDFFLEEIPDPSRPEKTTLRPKLVRGAGARLKLGPVVLFPLPTISFDLTQHFPFLRASAGNSKLFGYFALFRIGFNLGVNPERVFDPQRLYIDTDVRIKRGPALGGEFQYATGSRPTDPDADKIFDRGEGHIRVYGLDELWITDRDDFDRAVRNRDRRATLKLDGDPRRTYDNNLLWLARRNLDHAGGPSNKLETYQGDFRELIDFQHHQPLQHFLGLNDVQLDFKYHQVSDRDFELDYFRNNYLKDDQPEALASARKAGDDYSAELLFRANPQDFDGGPPHSTFERGTFTSYEPALSFDYLSTAIGKGFYLNGQAQAARVRRSFDDLIVDEHDYTADRLMSKLVLERPFRLGALSFRPYLGGQLTGYDDSRDGGSTTQGALLYGMDLSSRIYGTFDGARNDELGVLGFRHIIEPRISYQAVGDTIEKPKNVLDFDYIDNLQANQTVRFSVDQLFQTKRENDQGEIRNVNVAGFNIYTDLYVRETDRKRLLDGHAFDLLYMNGFLNVLDVAKVFGDVGFNMSFRDVETANLGIEIDPKGRWHLIVQERFFYHDINRGITGSDTVSFTFEYQLSERWRGSYTESRERRDTNLNSKGTQSRQITFTRLYGGFNLSLNYKLDKVLKENSFHVSFAPNLTYRNLVVPAQAHIVALGEVDDGEPEESRNFDPFGLMDRKHRQPAKNPQPSGKKSVPAPAPASPDDPAKPDSGSVPAPPPANGASDTPTADPKSKSATAAKTAPAKDAVPPAKRAARDDWSNANDPQ